MSQHGQDGLWGTEGETPCFLYAMPLGGNRVFLAGTCLVARPALPFATLKRRLERRCRALGIQASRPVPMRCCCWVCVLRCSLRFVQLTAALAARTQGCSACCSLPCLSLTTWLAPHGPS